MKFKFMAMIAGVYVVFVSLCGASQNGEILFEKKCANCHTKVRPGDMSTLIAPPMMGVMRHVKMQYATKEDAVQFITEYALHPQKENALCMPQTIDRFGLMPSQEGSVTKGELDLIAAWMYDTFSPANFRDSQQRQNFNQARGKQNSKTANSPSSPFLITSGLPHMTQTVAEYWDDSRLGLNRAQKEKLLVVRKKTVRPLQNLKSSIQELETKIIALAMQGSDPKELTQLIKDLSEKKAEATRVHINCIYDTSNILTPEQLQFLLQ